MRRHFVLAACLILSLAAGCREYQYERQDNRNLDVELVKSLNQIGVDNAVIAQQTLYPYHFVQDGEKLNDLGCHHLSILAGHYAEHEGTLNIRRGETSPELYEARMVHVIEELKKAGVDTDRMAIADGMPGGSGMPSERVVKIMSKLLDNRSSASTVSYSGSLTR